MYDKAKKDGALKQLTPVFHEWGKPGDTLIGAFISKGEVSSSAGGGTYYQYVFETDEGNVKFHLGRASDTDVGEVLQPGVIYAITFQGKEEISGGRRVNKFNVEELGPVTDFGPPAKPSEENGKA